ncbi:unnamed protein product [Ceutorhynchus assimilis]|uniref:Uncharacterized protein n=1 Tax=Ceutorhynchus assimilis TaxID=467358 RepID=A0A9N9MFK5_9CUCU|nr:unnamed protein product [Ceutorhynchus assimilis]
MAQFVTHIQPTLVEASHHHIPHPHLHHHKEHQDYYKDHHEKHEKHHKEGAEGSKDHHGKEKHGTKVQLSKIGHSPQHYPVLPATPSHHHHDEHVDHEHKRDSGQYLDSHGIPHTYQLHFIDSQGIHRDFHGHVEDNYVEKEEVFVRKAVPEDRSPYEKSPIRDEKRPVPPQFIHLHTVHGTTENKHQTVSRYLDFLYGVSYY